MHSPTQRTLKARAKINVLLHILERESGGHHGIETVYQRLALHDLVHVALDGDRRALECDGPVLPPGGLGAPEHNLAWRAAAAYADAAGWDTGWTIIIDKRIPVGGGVGGGSANAAAVLRALESLSPMPVGRGALLELAGELGADVPFLLADIPRALGWSRGDRMLRLPPLPRAEVTLVTLPVGMNTGAAYGAYARDRESRQERRTARLYDVSAFGSWSGVACHAENDFERIVPRLHEGVRGALPAIERAADQLRSQGYVTIGRMTGSGATCFLLVADRVVDGDGRVESQAGDAPQRADAPPPPSPVTADIVREAIDWRELPSDAALVHTHTE